MSETIVIDSGILEEKIQNAYKKMIVLDDLYAKLIQIKESTAQNESRDLLRMIQEVRQIREVTEQMYGLLERFKSSVENTMLRNQKELGELEEMVKQLFV